MVMFADADADADYDKLKLWFHAVSRSSVTVTKCHVGFHGWRMDDRRGSWKNYVRGGCGGDRQAKDTLLSERYLTNFEIKFD